MRRLEWGSGLKTLALVHGYTDDADTWWQVGPALADLGWRVVAPDLLGHGLGPRAESYSVEALVDELVRDVGDAQVVLGHSLGAVLVNLAGTRLRARQLVLLDPPWGEMPADRGRRPSERTVEEIRDLAPRWTDEDVRIDDRSNQRLDPAVTAWLAGADPLDGHDIPAPPASPTTLLLAANSPLVPESLHAGLRNQGFAVTVVPGVGHVVHRDDPSTFVRLVHEAAG